MSDDSPLVHPDGSTVPRIDLSDWRLRVWGQVERDVIWDWETFGALPRTEVRVDEASERVRLWSGVALREVLSRLLLGGTAAYVMVHAFGGYTACLSLVRLAAPDALLATHVDGAPLAARHGGPVRLLLPSAGCRSVKWVCGLEVLNKRWPGTGD